MTSTTAALTGALGSPLELLAAAVGIPMAPSGAAPSSKARPTAKVTTTKKAATTKTATTKATTKKVATTTAKKPASGTAAKTTGYATNLPADYAFLRDPKISIEEKLSRFIGLQMAKSEQDLLRQMEKMSPGSTAASGATGATAPAKPKSTKVSLWGLAKSLLPPLGLASQLVGDAKLKSLLSQVSGPVLAAAATAVGLPMLAPLAKEAGPALVGMLTKDISLDVSTLVGGGSAATSTSSTTASSSTTAKAASGDTSTSEKAQLMELQRLQDRDKELFSLFSNMLRSMHDTRMTAIQNLR